MFHGIRKGTTEKNGDRKRVNPQSFRQGVGFCCKLIVRYIEDWTGPSCYMISTTWLEEIQGTSQCTCARERIYEESLIFSVVFILSVKSVL